MFECPIPQLIKASSLLFKWNVAPVLHIQPISFCCKCIKTHKMQYISRKTWCNVSLYAVYMQLYDYMHLYDYLYLFIFLSGCMTLSWLYDMSLILLHLALSILSEWKMLIYKWISEESWDLHIKKHPQSFFVLLTIMTIHCRMR